MNNFFVYILQCNDGSYYTGHTENLELRILEHQHGKYSGYTSIRLPIKLVYYQVFNLREDAFLAISSYPSIHCLRQHSGRAQLNSY